MSVRFFIYRKALVGGGSDSRTSSGEKKNGLGSLYFFSKNPGAGELFFSCLKHIERM
jgi:hypothetical protein